MKTCEKVNKYNHSAIQNLYTLKGPLHPPIIVTIGKNHETFFNILIFFFLSFFNYFFISHLYTTTYRRCRYILPAM